MTSSEDHLLTLSFNGNAARGRSSAPTMVGETDITSLLSGSSDATPSKTVTLPMYRGAPSNFGVKLSRPGFGSAAELPTSPPA
jgi:hypothetical protein